MLALSTCAGKVGTIPQLQNIIKRLYLNDILEWCRLRDSNTRPPHYECDALPAELKRLALLEVPAPYQRITSLARLCILLTSYA